MVPLFVVLLDLGNDVQFSIQTNIIICHSWILTIVIRIVVRFSISKLLGHQLISIDVINSQLTILFYKCRIAKQHINLRSLIAA